MYPQVHIYGENKRCHRGAWPCYTLEKAVEDNVIGCDPGEIK